MVPAQLAQKEKAETLMSLHTNGVLLVLPNIWDPFGARILEAKGYAAVATASASISASLGYADGEKIKRSTLIESLSRIARSVTVPVTADIESGYGVTLTELGETIQQVIFAGIVGINIEDSFEDGRELRTMADQCERIAKVREVADAVNIHLVINARVDSFMSTLFPSPEAKMDDAVNRALAYIAAGADCIYPIGPGDFKTVSELRRRISAPLNIIAKPTTVPLVTLQQIGINRVTFGPFIFRSCAKKFIDIVGALYQHKGYECFGDQLVSGSDLKPYLIQDPE